MSDAAPQPKPKRPLWRRLLRLLFLSGLVLLLVVVLVLAGGVWYANKNRVRLVNRALENVGPYRGKLDAVELDRSGNFDVRGLELADKVSGKTVLRLPKITGKFEWGALRSNAIESLVLENPEIHLDEVSLRSLIPPEKVEGAGADVSTEGAKGFAGLRIDRLQLKDAKVSFTDKDGTRHDVDVNYLADKVSVDAQGLVNSGEQDLTVAHPDLDVKNAPYGIRLMTAKGRIKDSVVDLDEINIEGPVLHATPEVLMEFGVGSRHGAPAVPAPTSAETPPPAPRLALIRGIRVAKLAVKDLSVSAKGFSAGNSTGILLPDAGIVIPRYEADDLSWDPDRELMIGAQRLLFQDLSIASEVDDGVLNIRELSVALNPKEASQPWTVRYLRLNDPDIYWTAGLHKVLQEKMAAFGAENKDAPSSTSTSPPPSSAEPDPKNASANATSSTVRILKAGVTGATVSISDPTLMPFDLNAKAGLMLTEIEFGAEGWKSQSFQSLEVTGGRLSFPTPVGAPTYQPFFELPSGELVIKPDDWNANRKVAKLSLDKPVVRLREGNTPWIAHVSLVEGPPYPVPPKIVEKKDEPAASAPPPKEETPQVSAPPDAQPWWKRLHYGQLMVKDGFTDLVLQLPRPVDMQARVNINTERTTTGGSRHRVRIEDFTGKLPTLSSLPFPVLRAGVLEGAVLLPEMWSERRIEELKLSGANIEVGEALMKLFEPEKDPRKKSEAEPSPAPAPETVVGNDVPSQPWRVGHLSVTDSAVSLQNIVPGLDSVHFGVAFEVKDSPLLMEDILKDATPQQIVLENIRIPSVQDPLRSVAELDKIVISLSLQGLARKEIDHIEITSPTLNVGEDLFWYVDYYRKYMAGGTPSPTGPQMAANDDDFEFEVTSAVMEGEPPLSEAAWSIKRLQVHDGKLIIAPKGKPLFKTPFPFRVDTSVTRGTLQADLDIPPDTYPIPQIDLRLVGLSGKVQFNLPFKQKDNNLTEVFEVESIQYEDFKTGKAFLTVTYDKAGIYAKFGAEAYEGYLKGEVNVYLSDSYHWDGWVTGTNVETRHLAQILTPTYFFMEGKVETSLVAQGSMMELYQGDATFKNLSPGRLSIKALDDVIKDLPVEWDPLKKQITKIGLETMRDFDFDQAELKARFYGREGNGYLRFKGPQGSRNFDINVYDHRWSDDSTLKKTSP